MAVPTADLEAIAAWCDALVPAEVRDQLWMEYDVTNRHVDVVEVRPDWIDPQNNPHMRMPVARLRYTAYAGLWSIYWVDRNEKFHLHETFRPTPNVHEVLAFLDNPDSDIFWG